MSQAEAPSPAPRGKISVPSSRVRTSEQRAMILIRQHSMHFNEADTNNDNTMDYEEFVKSLPQHVRDSTPPDQLRTWFDMMDLDGSGEISRDEHLKWSLNAATVASGAGIEKVFQRYDRDGSGELSELEFARAARDMGLGDHAEHLFHSLPGSDNGSVSYLELLEGAKAGEGAAGYPPAVGHPSAAYPPSPSPSTPTTPRAGGAACSRLSIGRFTSSRCSARRRRSCRRGRIR